MKGIDMVAKPILSYSACLCQLAVVMSGICQGQSECRDRTTEHFYVVGPHDETKVQIAKEELRELRTVIAELGMPPSDLDITKKSDRPDNQKADYLLGEVRVLAWAIEIYPTKLALPIAESQVLALATWQSKTQASERRILYFLEKGVLPGPPAKWGVSSTRAALTKPYYVLKSDLTDEVLIKFFYQTTFGFRNFMLSHENSVCIVCSYEPERKAWNEELARQLPEDERRKMLEQYIKTIGYQK